MSDLQRPKQALSATIIEYQQGSRTDFNKPQIAFFTQKSQIQLLIFTILALIFSLFLKNMRLCCYNWPQTV